MAVEVFIAKMTDFMEEGKILAWLVGEGSRVEQGQPILEVETDKVNAELDAPASGFLKIRPGMDEGVTVPVGETIGWIVEDPQAKVEWP